MGTQGLGPHEGLEQLVLLQMGAEATPEPIADGEEAVHSLYMLLNK